MPAFERIVSLAPSNTELLYALGAEDRVVATTAICDEPEAATAKPSVGGWTTPDIDAVAAHDPDLVLAADELQDAAVDQCEDRGIPVKQVTPATVQDVFNTVKAIGEWVEQEEQARELVDTMNERMHDLAVPADQQAAGPRVYCEEWHDPPMVGGNWIPRLVSMVGGRYLIEEGTRSREVGTEEIQDFDPEHIVLHYCGFDDSAAPEQVTERGGWQNITAVEQGNVHVLDDSLLNRPGPRLLDGMQRIKETITNQ